MADSYKLNYYGNGSSNSNIQLTVGNADTSNTTLTLFGRNYTQGGSNGYGRTLNQNFVDLLQHSANTYANHTASTANYITGQIVFSKTGANVDEGDMLYLVTKTGPWSTTDNKYEILTSNNRPHGISWGNSNVAIDAPSGNILIRVNNTGNVGVISKIGNVTNFKIGSNLDYTYDSGIGIGNLATDRFFASANADVDPGVGQFYGNGSTLYGLDGNAVMWTTEVRFAHTANNVSGANVSGQVANANIAWQVYNNSQPNITSVGTLTGLTTSGVITSTLADGTAPFLITSKSKVANLNVDLIDGYETSLTSTPSTVVVRDTNGSITANAITGSLTTADQPNITSVGTLANLTVGGALDVGAGITGIINTSNQPNITNLGEVTFSGNITVSGSIKGTVEGNATSNVGGGNAVFSTKVEAPTGNFTTTVESPSANITTITTTTTNATTVNSTNAFITTGNITTVNSTTINATTVVAPTVRSTTLTAGSSGTDGTITGNWTLSSGSKMQATYADLAEYYSSELDVLPGTVVEFGGAEEIQLCDTRNSTRVAGIVSTDPAFVMNEKLGQSVPRILVALIGRVPCKVYGTCAKGDMMVAAGGGYAMANNSPAIGSVIGKALEDKTTSGVGVIEVVVGRL